MALGHRVYVSVNLRNRSIRELAKFSVNSRNAYFKRSIHELTENVSQFANWLNLTKLFHKLPKTNLGNLRNKLFVVFYLQKTCYELDLLTFPMTESVMRLYNNFRPK